MTVAIALLLLLWGAARVSEGTQPPAEPSVVPASNVVEDSPYDQMLEDIFDTVYRLLHTGVRP